MMYVALSEKDSPFQRQITMSSSGSAEALPNES
jgi:hypothetical protein